MHHFYYYEFRSEFQFKTIPLLSNSNEEFTGKWRISKWHKTKEKCGISATPFAHLLRSNSYKFTFLLKLVPHLWHLCHIIVKILKNLKMCTMFWYDVCEWVMTTRNWLSANLQRAASKNLQKCTIFTCNWFVNKQFTKSYLMTS